MLQGFNLLNLVWINSIFVCIFFRNYGSIISFNQDPHFNLQVLKKRININRSGQSSEEVVFNAWGINHVRLKPSELSCPHSYIQKELLCPNWSCCEIPEWQHEHYGNCPQWTAPPSGITDAWQACPCCKFTLPHGIRTPIKCELIKCTERAVL